MAIVYAYRIIINGDRESIVISKAWSYGESPADFHWIASSNLTGVWTLDLKSEKGKEREAHHLSHITGCPYKNILSVLKDLS